MWRFWNRSSCRINSYPSVTLNSFDVFRCLTTRLNVAPTPSSSNRLSSVPSRSTSPLLPTVQVKKLFSRDEIQTMLPRMAPIPLADATNFEQPKQSKRKQGKRLIDFKKSLADPKGKGTRDSTVDSNTVEDLIHIFDQAFPHVEFSMRLQKMNEGTVKQNNAVDALFGSSRKEIEHNLLGYLSKFNDQDLLIAIQFMKNYYPIDNEFTDQFTSALNNRLGRLSPQQIVRILEELNSVRRQYQWTGEIYQRLLTLAERRSSEFDNIRDILSLCYKLSENDQLIDRFDERLLDISDHLSFDDWFHILVHKSMLKRRDRTMIRAACYHLTKLSDGSLMSLEKVKDCLLACSKLNIHDRLFLERLIEDAYAQIHLLDDPSILPSFITSMGTLRLRHCDLLDVLGKRLSDSSHAMASKRFKSIHSFILTCASVQYTPSTLSTLINEYHQSLEKDSISSSNDLKTHLDFIWSLAILDQATEDHLGKILNPDTFQIIQNEISSSKIANALKVLALYSYSLQKSSKKFLKPTFDLNVLIESLTRKNPDAQTHFIKAISSFAPENLYSKFNVLTSNMILIDCLIIVDRMGVPQDLTKVFIGNDNSINRLNKLCLNDDCFKIALKCVSYQDKTLLTESICGPVNFQLKLLNSLGYKCVLLHLDEFLKIQRLEDRVKYIQRSIREAIQVSGATID